MELVLRKRSTGESLRLGRAKVLCHRSRKLAFLAPYAGQWVFYSLVPPGSAELLYNRLPAPARCSIAAGDLLNLNGLELAVESVEVDPGSYSVETKEPPACEIELARGRSVRVTHDLLIGSDASCGLRLADTPDPQPQIALVTFAAGQWHLHDLNGGALIRNGKPAGRSLVLEDGDSVRIAGTELVFRIGRDKDAGRVVECKKPDEKTDAIESPAPCRAAAAIPSRSSEAADAVYEKAKELCQQLVPVLRDPGRKFLEPRSFCRGLWGWLRMVHRPGSAMEMLDRLRFLLSGSPQDRVWLLELARFLFQQSYPGLCLRVLKELCRLYPRDVTVRQTLAKFYYQQGHNPLLPAAGRLSAFEHAGRCTQFVRRLDANDRSLADLERAIRLEQMILSQSLEEKRESEAPVPQFAEAMGRM
ncbi:MAG TPA: FHA domain-containing protein [Gemmataceae bacterium]|nr:FHA domain-containing protein [Gemmataceae bacterium]